MIKTALLLWDRLEYIVPWRAFDTQYADRSIAEAMEIIGHPHCPTMDEQPQAHQRLKEFVSGPLPPQFYLALNHPSDGLQIYEDPYSMYPEKLLPDSWRLLEEAQLAGRLRYSSHSPMTQYAGLTVMSILADSCAGTTRSRVTDRGDAYATITGLLQNNSDLSDLKRAEAHGHLVPISVRIINASKVSIRALVDLRIRERKERGDTLRDLRHRYVRGLESYVSQLADPQTTRADVKEIQRQFESDMKQDLHDLKSELGFARTNILASKEFVTTIVASAATAASWINGAQLPLENVVTLGGAPVAIGGLVALGSKYVKERKAIMKRHPMAYLYAAKRQIRRRQLVGQIS
ncbi:hypothetical protein [Bradyrhizobium sp. sBnM-33]|uniref:hypothetical protein n=1 Tax=Bradyrhizobium sp. sBnM-33 TaxID=2831780 RepID=UPI001BCAF68A|nr:hypothetical protein [Bradyrhizobium sp. sBnM-33]WOH47851.1 hypothetical protein RX328_27300 [Bradyrhizobium sp. sBnM-33]